VVLAAVAALRPDPAQDRRDVVVAARDLRPATPLTTNDVRVERRPAGELPDGTAPTLDTVLGATLTGPARRGEVLTDARLLSSRLAGLVAGPDAQVVPLHVAEAAVLDLIRAGDVVDVLGASPGAGATSPGPEAKPRVIAREAVVVLVSEKPKFAGTDRVVLLALPKSAAHLLAAATLVNSITLTIH